MKLPSIFKETAGTLQELYHQARLGRITDADLSIKDFNESVGLVYKKTRYASFVEIEAVKDGKKKIYHSAKHEIFLPQKSDESDMSGLKKYILSYSMFHSFMEDTKKIASELKGYGCTVKYEGKPYSDKLLNEKLCDKMLKAFTSIESIKKN